MKTRSFLESLNYAIEGIAYTISTQRNMKIHIVIGLFVILFSWYLHITKVELSIIFIVISLVFVAELLNTSIEILLDMIEDKYNKNVKHVKDIQAGAVLIFSIFSVIVGFLIFWPYAHKILFK